MLKKRVFTNWHTMRWVALAIGIFFAGMAFVYKDAFTGVLSAFFIFQAVTNTGCMVSQSCGVPAGTTDMNQDTSNKNEIEFTEVK
jgi:hypothetical protein